MFCGVGTAYCLPNGTVMPSEAVRIHASNGVPYGLNLCGSLGFINVAKELQDKGIVLPEEISKLLKTGDTLGPTITQRIAADDPDSFIQEFKKQYAAYLGELLGTLQLAFLAAQIFIGGSVGRAPMFLEKLIETEEFWRSFAKKDALRGKDMPILRINDKDATVRGAYAAASKYASSL